VATETGHKDSKRQKMGAEITLGQSEGVDKQERKVARKGCAKEAKKEVQPPFFQCQYSTGMKGSKVSTTRYSVLISFSGRRFARLFTSIL